MDSAHQAMITVLKSIRGTPLKLLTNTCQIDCVSVRFGASLRVHEISDFHR
jgi:hypothetical protein